MDPELEIFELITRDIAEMQPDRRCKMQLTQKNKLTHRITVVTKAIELGGDVNENDR